MLASRPKGTPNHENFRLEKSPAPVPRDGEVLLQTLYLSLDPYMRAMMNEVAPVYSRSVALGEVMAGGTVNRVLESRNSRFRTGDLVLGNAGWQSLSISEGKDLLPLFESFRRDMADWVTSGKVKMRDDIVEGLENAPAAFIGLLQGRNFGKLVIRLAESGG